MAELSTESSRPLPAHAGAGLVCRLRQKQGRDGQAGRSPTAGEVELENTSSAVFELELQMSPLQHLDLIVTDAGGNVVSGWFYGDCFSPLAAPYTWRLQPREKYTANVSLLGNVPEGKRRPGTYTVRAVYQYQTLRAVSEPIQVHYDGGDGQAEVRGLRRKT